MTEKTLHEPAPPRRDWLLASARGILAICLIVICLVGAGLLAASAAVIIFQSQINAATLEHWAKPFGTDQLILSESLFVLLLVMGALAFRWLRYLGRIIDSVGEGDAFAPVNAERLEKMGWLSVTIEILSIPAGVAAGYLTHHFHQGHVEIGLSLGGILMAVLLFILARVFREGTKMREDLEGTV